MNRLYYDNTLRPSWRCKPRRAAGALVILLAAAVPAMAADVTIGPLDAGVTLTVNGTPAVQGDVFSFAGGDTVTFVTTFNGQTFEDVIESHYDIDVAVHAVNYAVHPGATINLDTDLGYTPYDIFIITSTDATRFDFDFAAPPAGDAVKIIGFHVMVPSATIYELGDPNHTGTPAHLAEVFYGTVESNGHLDIETTCGGCVDAGSSFNKIVANSVLFSTSCSDAQDIMIQELYANRAETDDTEITWWRMELTQQFYCDDYDGYSLNDELPELDSLNDDGMLWFKARNPAKWNLYPLIKIDGSGISWSFDNYLYEDYNFWETHLAGDFYWYNDDDYNEYAHFIGPVTEMDSFSWVYYDDNLYINFFGDDYDNYYDSDRFDGDCGSAGRDFWNPLLTAAEPVGYGYTAGSLISPISVLKLRDGYFYTEDDWSSYDTELHLADNQDLLILSDTDSLEFEFDYGGSFYEGTDAHWVVEDGLTYLSDTPTDDAFNITIVDFQVNPIARTVSVTATNDYNTGDDTDSTMYLAYRLNTAYGRQLVKGPMAYDAGTGQWSAQVVLPQDGWYYFFTVATENDDVYGKAFEHDVAVGPDTDGDGILDFEDNCPNHANAGQADCDDDGTGDVCAIAAGQSQDCNGNGTPDDCEIQTEAAPADLCANADPVCPGIVYTGTTFGASNDASFASCASATSSPDVWYRYVPAADGDLTIDLCVSGYDTALGVYAGCPADAGNELDCDDDGSTCPANDVASALTLAVTAGTEYLIRVTGYSNDAGDYEMLLTGPDCLVSFAINDCNANGVPDDCDPDCDGDGVPDDCDTEADSDGDGVLDNCDVCPGFDDNADADADGTPDGCDACPNDPANDADGDGVCGDVDNCPDDANADQADMDGDGDGDACDADVDDDGVDDDVEGGAPNNGDANNDGIPDSQQGNVVSLLDINGNFATLVSPAGTTMAGVLAMDVPSPGDAPAGVTFPVGFFDFTVSGLTPGAATTIEIIANPPAGETITTHWKYGPAPDNATPHWYEFLFDGTTGAEISGNVITLHFVDGQRGDNDLTANGTIVDPGAPAFLAIAPPPAPVPPPAPTPAPPGANVLPLFLQSFCGIPMCGLGAMATVPATCLGLLGIRIGLRRRRRRSGSRRSR